MGHLGFMLMFDDFFGFRVLIALSSELPQVRQNGPYGQKRRSNATVSDENALCSIIFVI